MYNTVFSKNTHYQCKNNQDKETGSCFSFFYIAPPRRGEPKNKIF